MGINKIKNIPIVGANERSTALDVYFPEKAAKLPILIFAHGFKGYKDWGQFPIMLEAIANEGFCVLAMNFSHNGGTVDQPIDFSDLQAFSHNTYSKEQKDLRHLIDWCFSVEGRQYLPNCNFEDINLLGHSRGGSMVLLYAAVDKRINKVISWAAVADLLERLPNKVELEKWKSMGIRYIPNARTKQKMPQSYGFVSDLLKNKDQFDLKAAVINIKNNQLIVHGEADETVDVEDAKKLKRWNPQASLKLIPKAGHTFGGNQPYIDQELPISTIEALNATVLFLKEKRIDLS